MADVRWIKVYTDMISNKKIKRIRRLPEGNNIVLIWVFLLAQAGESNKSGALYLTDTLPFRAEDLAIEFDFEVTVINLALITLERFSMIEVFDEIIFIKNWNEYQNIEGMEKIREQTRLRNIKYRDKQKQLQLSDVTVTSRDATELELDIDIKNIVASGECDETFNQFWNAYPKKNGKAKAIIKWRSYFKQGLINMELIMNGLESYMKYVDHERNVRKFDRQYLDGLTFVNGERWNDDWGIQMSEFKRNTTSSLELIESTEEEREKHEQLIDHIRRQNASNTRGTSRGIDSVS